MSHVTASLAARAAPLKGWQIFLPGVTVSAPGPGIKTFSE
jgi:hypothetical protein